VRRFIQSKYQTTPPSVSKSDHSSPGLNQSAIEDRTASVQKTFSVEDIELWHHFLTETCQTFGGDPGSLWFWQIQIPKIGFSNHHFILNLTLSLAAFHLGRQYPERQLACLAQAKKHETIALRQVTALLPCLDSVNYAALRAAASLICFCHLARGPQPGEFTAFSENNTVEWLVLLRGVRPIMVSKRKELQSAVFTPIAQ
jgi:hypothetical protein